MEYKNLSTNYTAQKLSNKNLHEYFSKTDLELDYVNFESILRHKN